MLHWLTLLTHNVNQVLNISYILWYNSWAKLSLNNNKQFLIQQLMWMGISIAISLTISMLLPFPMSLAAIIGIFILLNFYLRKRMMKTNGMGMGIFGAMTPTSSSSSILGETSLNYYCMSCGTKHKETACPRCGSKMKRVGS